MKNLKIMLWILGILFLVAFVESFLPWSILAALAEPFGLGALPENAAIAYIMRTLLLSVGLIGAFILVMAGKPKKYKKMITLVGIALVIMAVYMFFLLGVVYKFENAWYYVDAVFCLIWGAGILKLVKRV